MQGYGRKGGTSATKGRKAETIVAHVNGLGEFRKRVFFGQRWLCVSQMEGDPSPSITAWHSEDEAANHCENSRRLGCEVHFVVEARAS